MSTDIEWEKWGARDPYFSVLTDPKFRAAAMTDEAREEFFALGRHHADYVIHMCRARLDSAFAPRRVLDFGCGVGRVVIPFAASAEEVVGVDISPSMLAEARRNCDRYGAKNVKLVASDDELSAVDQQFDLVHSCIVIQHIEEQRGLRLFDQLLRRVAPGGAGAIQVTFGWDIYRDTYGVVPPPKPAPPPKWHHPLSQWLRRRTAPAPTPPAGADPEMQMNFYNFSQLMFLLHRAGVATVHSEITDHGGALGAFMFFRRPG